ncbi:Rhomboid-related protein 2 [Halocaridina rubra]|uniref:Rhomboid-related protein 2 n=1 Tax=Halocaridina rubra TaxID=373956 RepID=A0AAN9A4P9_HALRR
MEEASPTDKWIQKVANDFWQTQDPDKNLRIPLGKVKESLLQSPEADRLPNGLVIQLLQKADENADGLLDYEEFMTFSSSASKHPRGRDTFSRAALTVLPRNERSLEKRTYLQQYSCCPPPVFMILTTLVEVGVFIYYMIDMNKTMEANRPAPIYSPLIYNPKRRYEAWRYMTYALIHSGYMHLINNIVVQLLLGLALELVHGWWRVGLIYLSGVLFGSLANSIAAPRTYLAGASGGVYSVEYAHIGNLLLNWSQMEFKWLQLTIVLIFSISDLSFALWDTYGRPDGTQSATGHMAHLGGAVAGITVGIYILRNLETKKWEKYLWWVAFVLFLVLVLAGVILNATLQDYFPEDDWENINQARVDYFQG